MVNLGTPRCSFANWQLPVSKLATPNFQTVNSQYKNCQLPFFKLSPPNFQTVKSQFSNCHIPVFKLSTKQSLLFLPPGASETANFTNFTNFANWVAKVATGNSQFLNCQCQLKYLRKSTLVNSAPKYSLQTQGGCLGKAPLCIYVFTLGKAPLCAPHSGSSLGFRIKIRVRVWVS